MDKNDARSRRSDGMRQTFLWSLLSALVLFLIAPSTGDTQVPVVTDITSSGLGTVVQAQNLPPPPGGVYNITGGTRPGGGLNLFHSFGDFTVGAGHIANFLNGVSFDLNGNPLAPGLPTSNVIGRVTGGSISNIDGTIRTTGFDVDGVPTNLFLVNPNGIVFGPHGSVDVGGSVSFSTAQYLRLFDSLNGESANFYADPANDGRVDSVLFLPPLVDFGFLSPAAYGFLTAPDPTSTITVQGSTLSVLPGQSISLVGGQVVIQGDTLPDGTVQQPAQLSAPNGRILFASTASPGEFDSTISFAAGAGSNVESVSFTSYATASLEAGSSINVSGASTGFFIKGGQLVLSVSDATLNTSGNTAPQNTILLGSGSTIWTQNEGTDLGADVQLIASEVHTKVPSEVQMAGAFIISQTNGSSHGGNVSVVADRVTMEQGSGIFPGAAGEGAAGNVSIQGTKDAGGVAESVMLSGGSMIANSTFGSGASGEISITATSLSLDGFSSTLKSSTGSSGPNGPIVVRVGNATLSNQATVESSTVNGGGTVGGKITVQGLQGEGSRAESLILKDPGTGIKSTGTVGQASLGDIEVHAKTVSLMDGAMIQAGSPQDQVTVGDIKIDANDVGLSGGSQITNAAFGFDAGTVSITADQQFSLNQSKIETNTGSPIGGQGGAVVLNVGSASLTNGATINSSSSGNGDAGNITINSASNILMQNSSVTTEASQASGGQVTFTAPDMIQLVNSKISTSVAGFDKDTAGGNINIDPQFVILQNSQILAQAVAGAGGAINIIATSAFIADPVSIVSASSTLGISGTVNIQSPLQNVGSELAALSQEFSNVGALLAQQCAARAADGKFSTFVIAAREGLPAEPGGFLASPSLTSELLGTRHSGGQTSHNQLSPFTGLFPQYDAKPIQLAKFGDSCHW